MCIILLPDVYDVIQLNALFIEICIISVTIFKFYCFKFSSQNEINTYFNNLNI